MWQAFYSTKLTMFNVGSQNGGVGRIVNGQAPWWWRLFWPFCWGLFCWKVAAGAWALREFSCGARWALPHIIFIGFTYVYVFSEAAEMTDYNRYIYPY